MASHMNRYASDYAPEGDVADVLKAALAGAAAVWMMDRFDWFAFNHEDSEARRRTERVRPGGMDPAHALVAKVAHAAGTHLGPAPAHQQPAGLAVHYAVPIGLAWLYQVLQRRWPPIRTGRGALYGASTFLVLDQLVNPMLGLAAHPRRYPWQRNARELAAHMIYGATVDGLLRATRALVR
jgi:hypothetical protein